MDDRLPGPPPESVFGLDTFKGALDAFMPANAPKRDGRTMVAAKTKKLRPRHRNVLMLHEAGYTNNQIADLTGYTPTRVSIILSWKDPEIEEIRKDFQRRVIDKTAEVGVKVQLMADEMLEIMAGHARKTENANNSRLAARDILHMAGYSPVKRTINADVKVPLEEFNAAITQMDKANEVVSQRDQWVVQNPRNGTDG